MKTTIRRWKIPIIRWSLKQLLPILPALYRLNLHTLARFGIGDFHKNEFTGELAIYIDPELLSTSEPEKKNEI